jgi:alpha-beta hydrolase superfamily lysophospholipase
MRFDYRGMGDSEGAMRTFRERRATTCAPPSTVSSPKCRPAEVVLWGLCDGASAPRMYAPQDARVAGLVLLNPWVRTEEGAARATIKHYYKDRLLDPRLWKKIASGQFEWVRSW